jgi:hypothetical protein
VAYPEKFKLNIQKYDSRSDPNIWLLTYYVAVKSVGGNFDHMATYFSLVMGDKPSLWLNNLPAGSITSWADLSRAFTSNFQATYNRPRNTFNLGRVTMKTNERLRDYTNWFFENCNSCVGVRDDQVVESYKKGIIDRKIFEKIHESRATTIAALMDVVNKRIDTDEALVNQFDSDAKRDAGTSGTVGDSSSKMCKRLSEVVAAEGRRPSTFNVDEFNAALNSPCTFHEGSPTLSASARSSRGCSAPLKNRRDLEATAIDRLHVATTTTAVMINVVVATTTAATSDVATSRSRRTATMSATYLRHR